MRAAVLHAYNELLSVEEVELAPPGTGEVSVRLHASGVCHSDWNTVSGATPNPLPAVLGHEGAGVVEDVGNGWWQVVQRFTVEVEGSEKPVCVADSVGRVRATG